jgi:uncharacterized protein (DUF885 family)
MMAQRSGTIWFGIVCLWVAGAGALRAAENLESVLSRFRADRDSLRFKYPDLRQPGARERMAEFYVQQLADLKQLDFDQLSRAAQIDGLLLRSHLEFSLSELALDAERDAAAAVHLPDLAALREILWRHDREHTIDGAATAEVFAKLAESNEQFTQQLEGLPAAADRAMPDRIAALRAAEEVADLQRRLNDMHAFYHSYDPSYSWWCTQPQQKLQQSLAALEKKLRERIVGVPAEDRETIIGQPIGADALRKALDHAWIPYTPAELIAIGERELAWCDEQMATATRELGLGDDWRKGLDAVAKRYVPPGQQPQLIHQLARESVEFLEARDLVTIPPLAKEVWRMEMMSAERQRVNPYFLGGDTIIVSYPTAEMTHAEKLTSLRGNNPHFARATVHHELIPGHHLQGYMIDRFRPERQLFRTPFWIEGWALYWELRLWEMDFARDAADRIGMLFWRRHRAARIVFSLKYEMGEWTPEQCVQLLVERVGHEPGNARAEVRRSVMAGYGPLYQAAYLLGGLQLRALHRELVESGTMSEREFHDAVLQRGPIPIELLRLELTDPPLQFEMKTSWRFDG